MTGLTQSRRDRIGPVVLIILSLGIALGLAQSLKLVFHLWGPDSDIADPVLIWQGIHRYGLSFVTMWRYTQDNWLLSVMPFDFLLFSIFGDRPVVVVATGLVAFWAMALLVGILVGRERGGITGGYAAMVLLFAGQPTIGNDGFLGYAISHGVSIVWGLLALLFCTFWLDRRRIAWLIGAGICLFVAAISDPWADAAFAGPIALASFGAGARAPFAERRGLGAITAMAVIAGVLARSRLLGILGFLPASFQHIATLPEMAANAQFAARYIAVFFNILPGSLEPTSTIPSGPTVLADCAAFAAVMLLCLTRLRHWFDAIGQRRQFVALTALISIGALIAALVVTGFQQGMVTARYLSNLFVFLPILLAASPLGMGRDAWFDRGVVGLLAVLFIVSGIMSDWVVWAARLPQVKPNGIPRMAAFLQSQGVSFGYGPYWWTEANAMSWVTHGKVTMRPIVFDPATRRFVPKAVQTLALWYRHAAVDRAPARMALVLSPAAGACGARQTCLAVAERQFGMPADIVRYQGLTMLIYDHRLYLDQS